MEKDEEGVTKYTINIGKPIYSDTKISLAVNKKNMLEADDSFKKSVSPK